MKFGFNNNGGKMFRLKNLKNGFYEIHKSGGPAFQGTPKLIFEKAIELGVHREDLTHAVNELTVKNDDYAEFGMFGRFIFTSKNKS